MYKLLVIDDEHDTRDTLCNCFPWESVGFTIVGQLGNGAEALHYMEQNPVDVMLCDIKMPEMSGIELTKQLSERKIAVRTVLLSAYREFEYARQAMQYGVKHYMVKPAKYNDIVQVFSELKSELDEAAGVQPGLPADADTHVMPEDPIVAAITAFVDHNYPTATLQQVSELVNMNASYVSAFFKKKTGINFSDYVQKVKMEKAAELLRGSHHKAYEVSELVGYVNAKNFIRSFKQYFGVTPGQYKNDK
ncbi:response regulator transcription factor [Paenibacillus thalictri]|uniref:Response regulator n=1 Tax=Paenibacillus thalictri TaxID=2527873 RepID=A0A4Q9DPH6_9BACL|nr:response regulator [Paenibacillus thalictri]TBL75690.1 response regulator [Paenibacillus thalictri]